MLLCASPFFCPLPPKGGSSQVLSPPLGRVGGQEIKARQGWWQEMGNECTLMTIVIYPKTNLISYNLLI